MPKPLPRWTRANPGRGKHGVPDKGAHKVAKQWEKIQQKKDDKSSQND